MNSQLRKRILQIAVCIQALRFTAVNGPLELPKVLGALSQCSEALGNIRDEEKEAFDNTPEHLQNWDVWSKFEDQVEDVKEIVASLGEINADDYDSDDIENWFDALNDALNDELSS